MMNYSLATNVTLRSCSPWCPSCGAIELSFQESSGNVVRLRLSAHDASQLVDVLLGVLRAGETPSIRCRQCGSQSSSALGNPKVAGSPQEVQKV